jgi:hypothetical protein
MIVSDYFEGLINEIDVKIEEEILKNAKLNSLNKIEKLNSDRELLIEEIKRLESVNLASIESNLSDQDLSNLMNNKEKLYRIIFKTFCWLLPVDTEDKVMNYSTGLKNTLNNEYLLILYVIDFYLSREQIEAFYNLMSMNEKWIKIDQNNSYFNFQVSKKSEKS